MRIANAAVGVLVFGLLLALALVLVLVVGSGFARADPTWQAGVSAVSRVDSSGNGGAGIAGDVVRDTGTGVAYGVGLDHAWLGRGDDSPDLDARQLDIFALARFGQPFALEVGAGVAAYSARVDIPEMPGCFGCGRYGGTTLSPLGRVGATWTRALTDHVALQIGVRLVVTATLSTATDVHNFTPQPATLELGLGLTAH